MLRISIKGEFNSSFGQKSYLEIRLLKWKRLSIPHIYLVSSLPTSYTCSLIVLRSYRDVTSSGDCCHGNGDLWLGDGTRMDVGGVCTVGELFEFVFSISGPDPSIVSCNMSPFWRGDFMAPLLWAVIPLLSELFVLLSRGASAMMICVSTVVSPLLPNETLQQQQIYVYLINVRKYIGQILFVSPMKKIGFLMAALQRVIF